jgi:hypothetical protein
MSQAAKPTIKFVYKRLPSAQRPNFPVSKTQPATGNHSYQLSKVPSGILNSEKAEPLPRPASKKNVKVTKQTKIVQMAQSSQPGQINNQQVIVRPVIQMNNFFNSISAS